MEFDKLTRTVRLNKTRIERIGYRSNMCDRYEENKNLINSILRQIAINLSYTIVKFDKMTIDELCLQMRKNCIKSFEADFIVNSSHNTLAITNHIEKFRREEAKAKLMFIHNQLWAFVNNNRKF